jgi:dimethylaniline monooxygenase (N-oxide forming)
VCIIGAGAAGIASANAISRAGVSFDWFEAGSQLGGIWRYGNDNGFSVYASLITNTSQVKMEWFGYRMRKPKNDYLTHGQVLDYLSSFAADANLQTKITVSTRVTSVEPVRNVGFRVSVESRSGERETWEYGAVVVAVGCHSRPKWPRIPGVFNGSMLHSADYRTPEVFAGKRVVVAGFGASGADIACDAADVTNRIVLATRSGGYVLPRYAGGRPRDEGDRPWVALLPRPLRRQMWRMMLMRRVVSAKVRAGLEQRAVPFAKPAVVNDRLADLIDGDRVLVKPGIKSFEGDHVNFSDGSRVACDVFVCATGYEVAYPFFSPEMTERNGSFVDRYLRVVPPHQPGLYFVGSLSVIGPFSPIFERQAMWVADLLSGRCVLPSAMKVELRAAKETRAAAAIFPDAGRRADTVEYDPYVRALNREHAAGLTRGHKEVNRFGAAAVALKPELSD